MSEEFRKLKHPLRYTVALTDRGYQIFRVELLGPDDFDGYERNHNPGWELVREVDKPGAEMVWTGNIYATPEEAKLNSPEA